MITDINRQEIEKQEAAGAGERLQTDHRRRFGKEAEGAHHGP